MKNKEYGFIRSILYIIIGYFVSALLSCGLILVAPLLEAGDRVGFWLVAVIYAAIMCMLLALFYVVLYKNGEAGNKFIKVQLAYATIVFVTLVVTLWLSDCSLAHPIMMANMVVAFPFIPTIVIMSLFLDAYGAMIVIGSVLLFTSVLLIFLSKKYKLFSLIGICIVCILSCVLTYLDSPQYKYKGQTHNFTYMNGFSSIDLEPYTPYSDSNLLPTLDHEPAFMIENKEQMPVMDGAEACYPVYSAIAKAIYKDIAEIEADHYRMYGDINGTVVSFYNTAVGFERLVQGDVDMFFGAKPSESQLALAEAKGIELEMTPVGKEAFVFFVNENNPVEGLTSDEIRSIYHGDINNWKDLGGKFEEIIPFQRPEHSGSQSMMVYFMGDISLKDPLSFEKVDAMSGIVEYVADYYNEAGAIGYSFRYFLEGLNQQEDVKMLKVDGIYPSTESISSGEYPIVVPLYCITVKGNENENVAKVLEFILSEDGQYLIEQTGYSPVK